MTRVSNLAELKQAVKLNAVEVIITDEVLARRVKAWQVIRTVANVLVLVILAVAIFAWANPFEIALLETGALRIARQVMLAVGVGLLFLEYLLPGTRAFKIAGEEPDGLRLVTRRK